MKTAYDIILRPIITEQSMEHLDLKKYVFEVAPDANKIQIKSAVEKIFGVKVDRVTTLHVKGKEKRVGRYPSGYRNDWKKAVVKLTDESKTIEFFEGMV
jgi:large subunit ribosomal protein L23